MVMQRYEPFRSAVSLRAMMDRLFDESFLPPVGGSAEGPTIALDITETDEAYTAKASMPGVKPEDVVITADGNMITIKGEIKAEEEKKGDDYLIRERRTGSYARAFTLPTAVDADMAEAHFAHGVLTLTVPKAEASKPKQIKVNDTAPLFHR